MERDSEDPIDPIMARATGWFIALGERDDPDTRAEFVRWQTADPRHADAYARLERLWGAAGAIDSLQRTANPPGSVDRRTVLRGSAGIAAAVFATLATGRLVLGPHPFADYRTGTGEMRMVALDDGSRIQLSTATALSLDFTPEQRRVKLLQGEAWFDVSSDPNRPFEVEAAGGVTRALGTSFAITHLGDSGRVSVTQHRVAVRSGDSTAELGEGHALLYGRAGIGASRKADATQLAWRDGRLLFSGRPLREVAAELDRWTGGQTIIASSALADRPVTLMTGVADADTALEKLAAAVPMRVARLPFLTIIRQI